jgi:aryl-alcohol dehydrogenase-like predicted oxidoreductase
MKTRRLGRTGLKVSELCLGTMTFGSQVDEAAAFAIMDRAASGGINFIDVADGYPNPSTPQTVGRSEQIVGKRLGPRRDDFVLATKGFARMGPNPWDGGLSRKHILRAVEDSLRRLGTDYIDLYQARLPPTALQLSSVLLGASRPEQMDLTLSAPSLTLDAEALAACDDAWFSLPRPRDPNIALR